MKPAFMIMVMIKEVFLTIKVGYFVILTMVGHTEGPRASKVSEVISFL